MRNRKLRGGVFLLHLILITSFAANGQINWDTLPYKTYADFKLNSLDKTIINSGILYDRVFPVADIERFKQQDQFTDTTSSRHWIQAYYEIFNSAYTNNSWLSPEALEENLTINAHANVIPIGVLNYKYNVIDTNAYVDNLLDTLPTGQFVDVAGRLRSPYFDQSTFIASPIISDEAVFEEDQEYTFYLDPQYFLHNDYINITQIRIDFGDGEGEWVVDNPFTGSNMQRRGSFLNFITKKIGKTLIGRIVVIGIDVGGHWIRYGNPFKILAKKKKTEYALTACKGGKGGGTKWVIDPDPAKLAPINAQYGNPPAIHNQIVRTGPGIFDFTVEPVKDTAYFFFKNDGNNCANRIVKRPIIFIDGFDPTNKRNVGDIYKDFINKPVERNNQTVFFGDYLLNRSIAFPNSNPDDDLDLIILDFKHGNDLLERNAMALVALIERLNQTYGANYLQDITLIGPSMGSLIAQYALAYMEHNNITHRVRTYISFDGCHQGANVPIGLQNYVEYITKRGILKGIKPIREGLYNGLAAKQMLAHHHSANSYFPAPDALRVQFLQNLAAVGEYPQLSRKVALINGAGNGVLNPNHGVNTDLLNIEIKRKGWKSLWGLCDDNICKKIKWVGRTATNSGTNKVAEMWTASPLFNVLFWVPLGKKNFYSDAAWANSSLDNAPGGLMGDVFSDDLETHGTFLAKELIFLLTGDKPTFNININNFTMMPSYSAADIRYPNKNLYQRIDQCPPTPFDHIYAPTENEEHVSVTPEGSIWFENEARGILPCNTSCIEISGPSTFCDDGIFSVNVPPGANVTWTAIPQIVSFDPLSGNQTTATRNMDGNTIIRAIIDGCSTPITKQISVGKPIIDGGYIASGVFNLMSFDENNPNIICAGYTINTQMTITNGSAPSWSRVLAAPTNNTWSQSGNDISFYFWGVDQTATFKLTSSNNCGTTERFYAFKSINCNGGGGGDPCDQFLVSPNPAVNNINIYVPNKPAPCDPILERGKNGPTVSKRTITQVKLFDNTGNLKKQQSTAKTKQLSMNISGLIPGIYYLEISDGTFKERQKVVIQ